MNREKEEHTRTHTHTHIHSSHTHTHTRTYTHIQSFQRHNRQRTHRFPFQRPSPLSPNLPLQRHQAIFRQAPCGPRVSHSWPWASAWRPPAPSSKSVSPSVPLPPFQARLGSTRTRADAAAFSCSYTMDRRAAVARQCGQPWRKAQRLLRHVRPCPRFVVLLFWSPQAAAHRALTLRRAPFSPSLRPGRARQATRWRA